MTSMRIPRAETRAAMTTFRSDSGARRPRVFGILNLTPDSFSDGGLHATPDAALEHADRMFAEGADGIDLGAESTRPGAACVPVEEELKRLLPVLKRLRAAHPNAILSVDTRKARTADACLAEGADVINDVSGLQFDSELAGVVAKHGAGLIVMHMRGDPATMQNPENLVYDDLIGEISAFFRRQTALAVASGIDPARIWLDPGVGFSKTVEQNLELIRRAGEFRALGHPLFYGISRKTFLGKIHGISNPAERDAAAAPYHRMLAEQGVDVLRVHNVAACFEALRETRPAESES